MGRVSTHGPAVRKRLVSMNLVNWYGTRPSNYQEVN